MYLGGGGCLEDVGANGYICLLKDVNSEFHVFVYTQYNTDSKFKFSEWHLQTSNTTNINTDFIDCDNIKNKHYVSKATCFCPYHSGEAMEESLCLVNVADITHLKPLSKLYMLQLSTYNSCTSIMGMNRKICALYSLLYKNQLINTFCLCYRNIKIPLW